MIITRLTGVAEKEYEHTPLDLKKLTKDYKGVEVHSDKIKGTVKKSFVATIEVPFLVKSSACIDGIVYAVTENRRVYKYEEGGQMEYICTANSYLVDFEKVIYEGRECVLLMNSRRPSIAVDGENNTFEIYIPVYSNIHAVVGNALYLAVKNRVIFEDFDNLENMNDGESPNGNFFEIPASVGKIIALIPENKNLLIFCERAIYQLKPFGESIEYQLSKKCLLSEKILVGSVCRVGDCCAFLLDGKVCRYADGKVERFNLIKDLNGYSFAGKAMSFNNKYLTLYRKSMEEKIVYFDFSNLSEGEMQADYCSLVSDGYLFLSYNDLYHLNEMEENQEPGEWQSLPIDLGRTDRKGIKGVGISADGNVEIEVDNGYEKRSLSFSKSKGYKKTNLSARSIQIKAKSNQGLAFSNLRLKYSIRGE